MNGFARSLALLAVCLYGSLALLAQNLISDQRHFTLPAVPVTQASPHLATAEPALPGALQPVFLNFDRLPEPPWSLIDCIGRGKSILSHGFLTIYSPADCYEFSLDDPNGIWNQYVSNSRGWIVEANLQVDPHTQPNCDSSGGSVLIWANDRTNLIILGISTNEICISYPEEVHFPMNTTDRFHVYRIENKGAHVKVFVDGNVAINHIFRFLGSGSQSLLFGDGTSYGTSLTKWDYFSYDVVPANLSF